MIDDEGFLSRLIESSQDWIEVLDVEGRLLATNAGGRRALEICDLASVIGSSWIDFWHGPDRQAARAAVEKARQGGTGRFVGFFPTTQTRRPKWWDVVISPIGDTTGKAEKLLAISRDVTEWKRADQLLRTITDGTGPVTGKDFFRSLVQHVASGLGVRFAFAAECLPNLRARALAFWIDGKFGEDFEYDLPGTPCLEVAKGRTCHYPDRIPELFPEDKGMIDLGTVSYLGVPLRNSRGHTIGHLVIFDDKPMPSDPLVVSLLETFAGRAGAELEREQAVRYSERSLAQRQALLEINNAIITCLNQPDLLRATSEALRRILSCDKAGFAIYDADIDDLRIFALEGDFSEKKLGVGQLCDRAGRVSGHPWDFTKPVLRRDLAAERQYTFEEGLFASGIRSHCAVPLTVHNEAVGTLGVGSFKSNQYSEDDLKFLREVANQVALAISNLRAFEEVRQLRDELAARKIAELEQQKQRINDQLERTSEALALSEDRFRDLFDEAPIAYVHEDLNSRFIRANRTALRILGIKPEEAVGTVGMSLVADTPENQRRVREAFQALGRGTDTGGVVLELHRKDNGKPVWIEWWSRPDPSGAYTRTMFLDITERVLMEQEKARLEAQNTYLQEEIRSEHHFDEIVGNSPALLAVLRQVDQVAPADSTVLIMGETGTGKELIARAIHDRSSRRLHPLIKVNCGAISAGLVESELFGHIKGAFTGALSNRDGRFKLAHGGTIFLDEVGELPLDTQVKLLRVLQEQEFEPVGSSQTIKIDVRIIAATNRDLSTAIREGKFRSDLFYRLNVLPIHNPPLRERSGDVPLLVTFFLQRFAKKFGKPLRGVSEDAMRRLTSYSWPGNIRELQNVMERAVVLSTGNLLTVAGDFQPTPTPSPSSTVQQPQPAAAAPTAPPVAMPIPLDEMERCHIEAVLVQCKWMIEGERGAARALNLQPSTLRSRMQKLGLRRPTKGG